MLTPSFLIIQHITNWVSLCHDFQVFPITRSKPSFPVAEATHNLTTKFDNALCTQTPLPNKTMHHNLVSNFDNNDLRCSFQITQYKLNGLSLRKCYQLALLSSREDGRWVILLKPSLHQPRQILLTGYGKHRTL